MDNIITSDEIISKMNSICRMEFEANWNLSEMSRALYHDSNKNQDYVIAKRELEDTLNRQVRDGLRVKVSLYGDITVYEVVEQNRLREVKRICSQNSKMLPYGYVMGKKVPKKVRDELLAKML